MKEKPTLLSTLVVLAVIWYVGSMSKASARTGMVEVPFDLYHNSIVVQAKVDGKGPFNMLLDTGVDPSVIDLGTAREIGLKIASTGQQGSGSGTEKNLAYETKLPVLELGNLKAKDVAALALDLSKTSKALGKPLHGVLGYSLLKDRVVQIDYPKHVARFYSKSPSPRAARPANGPRLTTLTFRYQDDILVDGVSVNGKKVVANLDTGSDGSFQLTPDAVTQLGLEAQVAKARASKSVGFNGATENREGTVGNVTLGGISIDGPKVVFYGKGTGRDNQAWGLRIGNAFLKDFVVTVDYQRHVITLKRP
jgi:predicted aspartyl protease